MAFEWMTSLAEEAWFGEARPFAYQGKMCATNGHALVLLDVPESDLPEPPGINAKPSLKSVAALLQDNPTGKLVYPLAPLLRWLQPPVVDGVCALCWGESTPVCVWCVGSGQNDAPCGGGACESCNGVGTVRCECIGGSGEGMKRFARYGALVFGDLAVEIDRAKLYQALRHLSGESISVALLAADKAVRIDGPGWVVLLMPLRPGAISCREYQRRVLRLDEVHA